VPQLPVAKVSLSYISVPYQHHEVGPVIEHIKIRFNIKNTTIYESTINNATNTKSVSYMFVMCTI